MNRQTIALARLLGQDALVQQMVQAEPALRYVMEIAAAQTNGGKRWFAYTALKRICDRLVGDHARNPDLSTSGHWEKMIAVLDELLPGIGEGEDEPLEDYEAAVEQAYYRMLEEENGARV